MKAEAKEMGAALGALEQTFIIVEPLALLLYPFGGGARKELFNPLSYPDRIQFGLSAHVCQIRSAADKAYRVLREKRVNLSEYDSGPTAKVLVRVVCRLEPLTLGLWSATHLAVEGYELDPVSSAIHVSWVGGIAVLGEAITDCLEDARELQMELDKERQAPPT